MDASECDEQVGKMCSHSRLVMTAYQSQHAYAKCHLRSGSRNLNHLEMGPTILALYPQQPKERALSNLFPMQRNGFLRNPPHLGGSEQMVLMKGIRKDLNDLKKKKKTMKMMIQALQEPSPLYHWVS